MSILDDILARLDHLEGLTNVAGEATQANYLTLDPATGLVGASFTGLVHALGLILTTPNEIDWVRPSDNQIVAAIHALDAAAGTQQDLIATAQAVAPGNLAFSRYGSTDSAGAFSGIIAEQIAAGPTSLDQVNMQVNGGVARTLLDGAGQSEFLQLAAGLQNLKAQLFTFTINGLAAGVSVPTAGVNFPTPFPTSAIGMVATVQTGTANNSGLYVTSCIPTALGTFAIDITNPALQNVTCAAIAWGA